MSNAVTRVLDGWELDVTRSEDPRVRDLDVAVRAGMKQPRNVRLLIERHRDELEAHGKLDYRISKMRQSTGNGGSRELVVREYWLSEPQALSLLMHMRTPTAMRVRVSVVQLFVAWRHGQLPPPPPATTTLPLDVATGPRVGEHPLLRDELARRCSVAAKASGRTIHAVHGAIRRVMRVPGVYQLPVLAFDFAKRIIDSIALGELTLPGRAAPVLRLVDKRQMPLPGVHS